MAIIENCQTKMKGVKHDPREDEHDDVGTYSLSDQFVLVLGIDPLYPTIFSEVVGADVY
jgi:hypothetical protein